MKFKLVIDNFPLYKVYLLMPRMLILGLEEDLKHSFFGDYLLLFPVAFRTTEITIADLSDWDGIFLCIFLCVKLKKHGFGFVTKRVGEVTDSAPRT